MPDSITLKDLIMTRFDASDRWLTNKRVFWSEYEDIKHSRLNDRLSGTTKSQVYDPVLETLSMERSFRVMAQLSTGKVEAISKNDEGASALMNLSLDKYVVPNAKAQFDLLTKFRLTDELSSVYGSYYVLVDWDVKPNGYIGPDMWLIPIRDVFPQVGAISIPDSDYIIIRSWRSIDFFEGLLKDSSCKNIPAIIAKLKEKTGDKQSRDQSATSQRELQQYPTAQPTKGDGYFEVLSMYERDRWVDWVVAAEMEFRDGPNPHENGELPVVCKYSTPLIDDIMGRGDYERGKTMQYANNSLWNLYLDGVKVSIFPPVMFDKNQIADKASIKWGAAEKWMFKSNPATAAQMMNLTPQGIQTFNQTLSAIKGSLLNQFSTTDTTVSSSQDPGFGRTPEALKQQGARQNSRDTADRFYMEQFVSEVYRKFVNLLSKKGEKIQFRMFQDEIKQLAKQFPEINDMYDEKTGKLTIDNKKTGSIVYDYKIVTGSTFAADQQAQQGVLADLFKSLIQNLTMNPQTGETSSPLLERLKSEGKDIQLGNMFTKIIAGSGIQDWDDIVVDQNKNGNQANILDDHMNKFKAAMMALGGPSDIPTTPNGAPGGAGGVVPHEVVNIKDVPPWAQNEILAQAGVVPPQGGQPQPTVQNGPAGQPLPPNMRNGGLPNG